MKEEGWAEVVVGRRQEFTDRLYSAAPSPFEFDPATIKRLAKIDADRVKLEKVAHKLKPDDPRLARLERRWNSLDEKRRNIEKSSRPRFSEKTMAKSVAFLMLDPDGQVHTEYRLLRREKPTSAGGSESSSDGDAPRHEADPQRPMTSAIGS